jgi:hypothetical protein
MRASPPCLGSTPTLASDLNVTKSGRNWRLVVPVGASTVTGVTPVIAGRLTDSCAGVLSNAGYGYAKSNLSTPIAIVVTAAATSIARPSTPAASTLGFSSTTQLTVTVTFRASSGTLSYVSFTTDSRTTYSPSYVNCVGMRRAHALTNNINSSSRHLRRKVIP